MACNYNYNCKNGNKISRKAIFSTAVTVLTIDGTDTLVIDIPASTYFDGCQYCLFITQTIPATATINMPVALSIAGVTTTVYPLTRCDCSQATACSIRTRTKYSTCVVTTPTGGSFRLLGNLCCAPNNNLRSINGTAPTTTTPA